MPRPRRLGSSPSLNRSLSRLSSSTSFPPRQSNSRIYVFLIAGGICLLVTVAFLQVHLLRAPHGSKLSPLENGKSDETIAAEQARWKENLGVGNTGDLDPATGKPRAIEKGKVGRKMGAVQAIGDNEDGESSDEDMEAGEEMGDEGDDEEDADQDRFDIDIDDRILEEEAEDLEDMNLGVLAEMSNEEDSAESVVKEAGSSKEPVQMVAENIVSSVPEKRVVEKAAPVKLKDSDRANNDNGGSISTNQDVEKPIRRGSKQDSIGKVGSIPDWVLDTKSISQQKGAVDTFEEGFQKNLVKDVEKRKGTFFWDHALGVRKKPLENVDSLGAGETKDLAAVLKRGANMDIKHAAARDESAAKVAVLQLRGFKEVVQDWKERFNSDDELLDDTVQQRLEGVREIEDALLLNGDGAPDKPSPSKKFGSFLKKGRGAFDPMNPVNNPMLQDPDTSPGTWMTKSDKQMLRAMRGDHFSSSSQQPKVLLRGKVPNAISLSDSEVDRQASTGKGFNVSEQERGVNTKVLPAKITGFDGSEKTSGLAENIDEKQGRKADSPRLNSTGSVLESLMAEGDSLVSSSQSKGEEKQWGYYPGIRSSLSFSNFISTFLGQESCSLNVFLAWTTPAWGFTARHQRVLESLFRFHRNACVVVFSETFEFDFFKSFTKEGYNVSVVRPNLQELLADTPCDVFAAVLPLWKEKPLFHLHYTELLRLAALYKFGGLYMDMDMIVLRPLDSLHNTVGSEITASGELRLNGAILVFDKSSPFLKKCMEEFRNTYDETLVQWNGADLLTRVANSTVDEKGSTWRQFPGLLKIQGPFSFFPLDSSRILKFFVAPEDDIQKRQQGELLTRLSEEAYTVHLWNSITSNKVPEISSLVGTILSRSCLRCKDSLQ
ncbi:hypothetical protein KC19_5G095200 [Ceratodon purpureus]|uniref:Alpha 1,4-glycosyltransferase domain-containing protein n=1 Tax=Ceratodon purpureus TaxID=3225 RepID=A0A8T0I1T9_CERPU|nr:hypothetical protein KC19_5G095200 [Ceratodon purpureus]